MVKTTNVPKHKTIFVFGEKNFPRQIVDGNLLANDSIYVLTSLFRVNKKMRSSDCPNLHVYSSYDLHGPVFGSSVLLLFHNVVNRVLTVIKCLEKLQRK